MYVLASQTLQQIHSSMVTAYCRQTASKMKYQGTSGANRNPIDITATQQQYLCQIGLLVPKAL